MKKIIGNEKGLTLMEVIISLTILLVVTLAISSLIGVVSNGKRMAEQKQSAMLLGQQVMEELQLVDVIYQTEAGYELRLATLGALLNQGSTENETYQQQIDNFTVTIDLKKSFEFEQYPSNEVDFGMILDIKEHGKNFKVSIRDEKEEFFIIYPDAVRDSNLFIDYKEKKYEPDKGSHFFEINFTYPGKLNNSNILLSFEEEFTPNSPLLIDMVNNSKNDQINVYFENVPSDSSYIKINMDKTTGGIKFYNNFVGDGAVRADLYEAKIQVKQQEKVLFETYGNKKFKVKTVG